MDPSPRTDRYAALLAVTIGFLLVVPPLADAGFGVAARAVSFPAILAVCALAAGDERRLGRILLGIACLGIAGEVAVEAFHPVWLVALVRLVFTGVLALVVFVIVARILRADRITLHSLVGGASAYLLIGVMFASVFGLLEFFQPGSFVRHDVAISSLPGSEAATGRFQPLVYFSFVTLTTLGYGEIVPATALAGMLTTLEAVVGQLYLAIFVAGLVGMHLAQSRSPRA